MGNAEEISRRSFVQGAVGVGIAAGLAPSALLAEAGAESPGTRPNILYIHSHDSGRFLQPFGHSVPTPSLTKLAKGGVLFRNAFCAAPTCSPSRACLFSGMSAHESGMLGLVNLGFQMKDYSKTLVHTLKAAGYTTILGGLQHIAPQVEMLGYDVVLPHKSTSAKDVAPAVVEFLKTKPKGPFFLDVGFFETHRSYPGQPHGYAEETPLDDPNYVCPPAPLPDTPKTRKDTAGFYASARVLDAGISTVLSALETGGYGGNLLVISTTDHGISFPTMKCGLRDTGMGVSLIMNGAGMPTGGKVVDAMVSHLDVYPTLCELLRVKAPDWLEGKSLLPLLSGAQQEIHDELFAEVNYHASYEPKRAIRTKRWKYIVRYDGRTTAVLPNCDDGWSKDEWLEHDWQHEALDAREELYDLEFDPNEQRNLATDAAHQDTLADLKGRLNEWMQRTQDPLLKGPIPLPKGARAYDPNAISDKDKAALEYGT